MSNYSNPNIKDFKTMAKAIDMKRFFKPDTSHYEFAISENLTVSPKDPHPSIEGHNEWAKQLKEFIDVNNLRTI